MVEDSEWTLDQLRAEGFSEEVVRAVDHVTRRGEETYAAFVQRAGEDPVAARAKAADLIDNMDLSRIASPTAKDHERIAKYERALASLQNAPSYLSISHPSTTESDKRRGSSTDTCRDENLSSPRVRARCARQHMTRA